MEKLTYEDYQRYGGKKDHSAFLLLLEDCEAILKENTFDRITTLDGPTKRCMVKIIDDYIGNDETTKHLSSYSNGIETFGFASNTDADFKKEIRALCKTYLPKELTYRGVK